MTGTSQPSPLPVDSLGMWKATIGLPEQVAAAASTAHDAVKATKLATRAEEVRDVVVVGMGGSGIAGDVLQAVAGPRCPVPVVAIKDYRVPRWVGSQSLVFAVSCSGDTEETLAASQAAWEAGATVVVVSAGGALGAIAEERGAPWVPVPSELPQPRSALGALAIPPLVVLGEAGLLPGPDDLLEPALVQLRRRRDELAGSSGLAVEVAGRIGRTVPLVHGAQGVGAVAATRWKTQINENAKSPAFVGVQPELCHNEVVGWGQHGDVTRQALTLVTLRYADEHPQVARRFAVVSELMREVAHDVIEVRGAGGNDLAQLLDLVLIGDLVSLHMAAQAGVDPGPAPILSEIKRLLRS